MLKETLQTIKKYDLLTKDMHIKTAKTNRKAHLHFSPGRTDIPVWAQRNGESLPGVISVDDEEVPLPIKKSISHHSTLAHFRLALEIIVVKVCNKQEQLL